MIDIEPQGLRDAENPEYWKSSSMPKLPMCELRDVAFVHYGKGLKESERNNDGPYTVIDSAGPVGKHVERLVGYPTLIIGRKGSVGEVYLAENGGWPIDTTFYLEIDPIKADLRYLYYALRRVRLGEKRITTSIPGLNRDDLYSTRFYLPPLSEQKRIAAILDKADAIRRKRQQAIQLADEFLRSVFLDMFGDPVANTKRWPTYVLSHLGKLARGKSKHRPRNDPVLLGGPYPLIQTGDIAQANHFVRSYTQTYSEVGLKQSKIWPRGTLCITIAANIADTAILTFDACFPDSVVGFKPSEKIRTEFIHMWLRFYQKILRDKAPESAQKNINLEILSKLDIPLPPSEQ